MKSIAPNLLRFQHKAVELLSSTTRDGDHMRDVGIEGGEAPAMANSKVA